jgi:hypothetical protein
MLMVSRTLFLTLSIFLIVESVSGHPFYAKAVKEPEVPPSSSSAKSVSKNSSLDELQKEADNLSPEDEKEYYCSENPSLCPQPGPVNIYQGEEHKERRDQLLAHEQVVEKQSITAKKR